MHTQTPCRVSLDQAAHLARQSDYEDGEYEIERQELLEHLTDDASERIDGLTFEQLDKIVPCHEVLPDMVQAMPAEHLEPFMRVYRSEVAKVLARGELSE